MAPPVPPRPFSTLPAGAQSEVHPYHAHGVSEWIDYYIDDELVWRRYWSTEGLLDHEQGYRNGVVHGACRYWHENGVLSHETYYLYGREHGISHQFDDKGNLIGTYVMVHGTGLDQWYEKFDNEPAFLTAERQYQDGNKQGWERWYGDSQNPTAAYRESHYHQGKYHGILREWNNADKLRRGFPQYYVNDERVSKRCYLNACKRDPSLPPFRLEDNDCHREPLVP